MLNWRLMVQLLFARVPFVCCMGKGDKLLPRYVCAHVNCFHQFFHHFHAQSNLFLLSYFQFLLFKIPVLFFIFFRPLTSNQMLCNASPSVASGKLKADGLCVPLPPCRGEPGAILRPIVTAIHWTLAGVMGGISKLKRSGDPSRRARSPVIVPRSAPTLLNVTAKVRCDCIFSSSFYVHAVSRLVHIHTRACTHTHSVSQ